MTNEEISHATARVPQEVYQAALDRALKAEMLVKQMREALQEVKNHCYTKQDCDRCRAIADEALSQ